MDGTPGRMPHLCTPEVHLAQLLYRKGDATRASASCEFGAGLLSLSKARNINIDRNATYLLLFLSNIKE
jgi:hypothetical protein